MNIVDLIKGQLTSENLSRLGSLIGESEDKTKAAASAAVPSFLSVLASLASSSGGAEKVINALKQVDPGTQGGFGDILSGPQSTTIQEKGGSLLNILLGAGGLPILLNVLSKFAGIASGPAKGLLSYLTPLILAMIAKQFTGKPLTTQSLSSFFADQKANINAAMPAGLSLADIPGLGSAPSHAAATVRPATTQPEPAGLPPWLLPLVGLGLLGALAWYFMGGQPAELNPQPLPPVAPEVKEIPPAKPDETVAVPPPVVPADADAVKLGTDLTSVYTGLTEILNGIKDVPTAEQSVTKLADTTSQVDGLKAIWDKLPDSAKATVAKITTEHLGTIKELIEKVLAIPGVGEKIKPALDTLVTKLAGFAVGA